MGFPRAVLAIVGLGFVAVGAAFLVSAPNAASLLALRPTGFDQVSIRAVDGGLQLGLGIFFLVANARERWIRAGLGAVMLSCGGLAFGRAVGMWKENQVAQAQVGFLAAEVVAVVIAFAAFSRAKAVYEASRADRRRTE